MEFPLLLYSGISSLTTTVIIDPAVNDRITGKIKIILLDNITPNIPPIGSIIPGNAPVTKDLNFDSPSFLRIIDKENPSGKFCRIIAMDKVKEPAKLPLKLLLFIKEKAIPIEIPSIKFLKDEDRIIKDFFLRDEDNFKLFFNIIDNIILSMNLKDRVPIINPAVIYIILVNLFCESSVAGISKDHIDEEIIIPDINPKNNL